jgi:hypothetical protein
MAISRYEGYRDPGRQASGRQGLEIAAEFLRRVTGSEWDEILDAEENYRMGDLRCTDGRSIEVKTQPIDPKKYEGNFVEICELTDGRNLAHHGAFEHLAAVLGLDCEELAAATLVDKRVQGYGPSPRVAFGHPKFVSISIAPLAEHVPFMYVNTQSGLIAAYPADTLLQSLRRGIQSEIWRGAGGSNADTCGVQVDWPATLLDKDSVVTHAGPVLATLWPQ